MRRAIRVSAATCLIAAFIAVSCSRVYAGELETVPATQQSQSLSDGAVWRSTVASSRPRRA